MSEEFNCVSCSGKSSAEDGLCEACEVEADWSDHCAALKADNEKLKAKLDAVGALFANDGCDCDCDCDTYHVPECEMCLPCRVAEALR